MTTAARPLVAVALLTLLTACQTEPSKPMNGTTHPIGEAWGKRLDFAVEAAPWIFAALLVLLVAGAVVRDAEPRRGRHRSPSRWVRLRRRYAPRPSPAPRPAPSPAQ